MELQKENTQMEDIRQPWHKPEVMGVEVEATMNYGGDGVDMASETSVV